MNTNVATSKQEVPKDLQDLYAVLGVSKEATQEEIKQAYRVAAMKYHPDRTSGDPESIKVFQAIQHAYDVLSDVASRKYYDETGKIKPTEEQLKAQALDVLNSNIISCIDSLAQSSDPSLDRVNPITEVRNKLTMDVHNAEQNLLLLHKMIKRYEQIAKRMKSKKVPQFEKSPVGILINEKLENVKESIEKISNLIEIHKLALKMIEDYDYELETIVPGSVIVDPYAAAAAQMMANNTFFQNNFLNR